MKTIKDKYTKNDIEELGKKIANKIREYDTEFEHTGDYSIDSYYVDFFTSSLKIGGEDDDDSNCSDVMKTLKKETLKIVNDFDPLIQCDFESHEKGYWTVSLRY